MITIILHILCAILSVVTLLMTLVNILVAMEQSEIFFKGRLEIYI